MLFRSTMIDYIEGEINTYVTNVLLKLGGNTREGLNEYTLLLNNPDLDLKLKEELIQKTETIIQDINAIDSIKVCHLLFNYSKVIPKWENIQSIFERNENMLSEDVIKYLNNDNNANELSKVRMTSEANEDGIKVFSLVCKAIIQESSIKDE